MAGLQGTRSTRGALVNDISVGAEAERTDMWTSMPGRIVSFDPASQTATVKILYRPRFNGEPVDMPDLLQVPCIFPRGGGAVLTFPVRPGDGCKITFHSRNLDAWHEKGEAVAADTARMHDLSDATAELGMEPSTRKLEAFNNEHTELRSEDGKNKFSFDQKNGKFAMVGAGGKHDVLDIVERALDFLAKDKLNGAGTGPQGGLEYQKQFAELKDQLRSVRLA